MDHRRRARCIGIGRASPGFLVLAVALVAAACGGDERPSVPGESADAAPIALIDTAPRFLMDTVVDGHGEIDTLRLDSLRAEMVRLEQELTRAPEPEHPRLLLELGRVKRLYIAPHDGSHAEYARTRADEYMYDEIGGRYVYRGRHLEDLIERFPAHPLADDAAWQLTLLPPAGECEGFVVCYIQYHWRMVRDFLGAHPASPHAPRALDRAIAAFEENLEDVTDLTRSTERFDAGDLPPLLAEFDSVAAGLPVPLRHRAEAFSAGLRRRIGGR